MEQKIKGNPHFKGILDFMQWILTSMLSAPVELKYFRRVGRLLSDYDLPKKENDVCYIVERLDKMKEYCNNKKRIERLQYARNHLDVLTLKIKIIFFTDPLFESFVDGKDIKITLNDGTEVIIVAGSLNFMRDPITGRNPKGEDVKVYIHDIKLKDGIQPLSTKEMLDIKGLEPIPSGEKGLYTKKRCPKKDFISLKKDLLRYLRIYKLTSLKPHNRKSHPASSIVRLFY